MYICNHEINAMCFPGYHHNNFVATHALAGTNEPKVLNKLSCYKAIVVITGRAHCFLDCIYITRIIRL